MEKIAVLTGDIVNSRQQPDSGWIRALKPLFNQYGKEPADWEIYRGDEFQLRLPREAALQAAFHIKALVKQWQTLDVRLGIGLGEESVRSKKIGESNGTAYQRSGAGFEKLKRYPQSMYLDSGDQAYDQSLNLMLALAMDFMDAWSPVSAEVMALTFAHPEASQEDLANRLGIRQSAVSQRLKRARYELVEALLTYYSHSLKN